MKDGYGQTPKMSHLKAFTAFFLFLLWLNPQTARALPGRCADFLNRVFNTDIAALRAENTTIGPAQSGISEKALLEHVSKKITEVPEFEYLRGEAEKLGIRVWLFGGTASSFLHYVKWDLLRERGLMDLQKDRFDYDFTNIFRSTQDLDIVVDASPEAARQFQNTIAQRFPHFLGSKANRWEVRTLRHRMGSPGALGFKEALLDDSDFNNQNTDSNSLGMVEVSKSQEPVVRDLKHWNEPKSLFLEDVLNNRISFLRSDRHFKTSRAKLGENPEILAVIRLLVKAFQYELEFSEHDFNQMKEVVRAFDPKKVNNEAALRRINDSAKKLILHAVNIEYAVDKLEELGLRKKLISMGNKGEEGSTAWWLNREPLRSKPLSQRAGKLRSSLGKTAEELGIKIVAHETNSFLAYESITRAHSGEPNVLISRQNVLGETAGYEDGFYTRLGKEGARGTGLTIRFMVDPGAREGADFTVHGEYNIVFKNKKALKVIPESLHFGPADLLELAETHPEFQFEHSDSALLEKLKKRLDAVKIIDEFDKLLKSKAEKDQERVVEILSAFQNSAVSKLISENVFGAVAKNIFGRVQILAQSSSEADLLRYIKTVGAILKTLDSLGLLKSDRFFAYLNKQLQTPTASFELRKQAVLELLLSAENFERYLNFKEDLSHSELKSILSEIRGWPGSRDPRKRKFEVELNRRWSEAVEKGEVKRLAAFADSGLFDLNHKNVSDVSMLQLAACYAQNNVIEWLVENPGFDFNRKNKQDFTEVEQLRLSGRAELADAIEQRRPEARARNFPIKERNGDGSPIADFVRIEPGSFMMGDGQNKVLTTLTKPFEIMSTLTTQETYGAVVSLIKAKYRSKYGDLNVSRYSYYYNNGGLQDVSYDDIDLWNKGLNELSNLDDVKVQRTLTKLLPGHKKGARYRLPTEAEWELTARLGGVAEGDYSSEWEVRSDVYPVYSIYPGVPPAGTTKPVFYNGKPIYDMHQNVPVWTADWYDGNLPGGIDPQGPQSGVFRVARGGPYGTNPRTLHLTSRLMGSPDFRSNGFGLRLVRVVE